MSRSVERRWAAALASTIVWAALGMQPLAARTWDAPEKKSPRSCCGAHAPRTGEVGAKEPALRGYVCRPDGRPVPGGTVLVNMRLRLEVDQHGVFVAPAGQLKPGADTLLLLARAEKDGKPLRCARFADYVTGRENVTLRLKEAAVIRGRITSASGEPIAGATVRPYLGVRDLTCHGMLPAGITAKTNDRGSFTLTGLYPDTRYRLRVRAAGFERKLTDWILVAQGVLGPRPEIILRDAPGSVAGRVVTPEGKPLAGVRVILGHPCLADDVCRTDSNGRFEFADLVPGKTASIWVPRGDVVANVPVGTKDLVITRSKER